MVIKNVNQNDFIIRAIKEKHDDINDNNNENNHRKFSETEKDENKTR